MSNYYSLLVFPPTFEMNDPLILILVFVRTGQQADPRSAFLTVHAEDSFFIFWRREKKKTAFLRHVDPEERRDLLRRDLFVAAV